MTELRIHVIAFIQCLVSVFLLLLLFKLIRSRMVSTIISKVGQSQESDETFLIINLGLERVWDCGECEREVTGVGHISMVKHTGSTASSQNNSARPFDVLVHALRSFFNNFGRLQAEKVTTKRNWFWISEVEREWKG